MSNTPRTQQARQAKAAAKAEAKDKPIEYDFEGHTYTLPTDPDIDVIELSDDEKYVHAVRALVGVEQYRAFRSRHSKVSELERFLEGAFEAMGGNSSASSP